MKLSERIVGVLSHGSDYNGQEEELLQEIKTLEAKLSTWETIYERYDPTELHEKATNWDLLERLPQGTIIEIPDQQLEERWPYIVKSNDNHGYGLTVAEALRQYFNDNKS